MPDTKDNVGGTAVAAELKSLIERIERLAEERKAITDDIKDVFAEGKARGFDPKTMRRVIVVRKMAREAFEEQRALEDTYLAALGIMI